jgi:hypothetical protein
MKSTFFEFETDYVDSLRCIPMIVRLKLDTCGVKLKLNHWNSFSQEEKEELVNQTCETNSEILAYKNNLQELVIKKHQTPAGEIAIDPHPPWLDDNTIPEVIETKAAEFKVTISTQQWQKLTPLQRFALLKLSRPSHENSNFYPALQEFKII